MIQTLEPISDINAVWTCSSGSLRYALIDGIYIDDGNYIYGKSTAQTVKLSTGQLPSVDTKHKITARVKGDSTYITMTIKLLQGTTVIYTVSSIALTTGWVTKSWTVPEANIANITDYSDLRLSFQSSSSNISAYVSIAYLEIPEGLSIGLEMGCWQC